jgi:hypothetical protein
MRTSPTAAREARARIFRSGATAASGWTGGSWGATFPGVGVGVRVGVGVAVGVAAPVGVPVGVAVALAVGDAVAAGPVGGRAVVAQAADRANARKRAPERMTGRRLRTPGIPVSPGETLKKLGSIVALGGLPAVKR